MKGRASGFTLLEMMVSMGIFLLICASAFTLLGTTQQSYQAESQVLNSFEEAQLGLDQIVRDVNDAGYPPPNQFENYQFGSTTNSPDPRMVADTAVAWSPNLYPGPPMPCYLGGGGPPCNTPGPDGIFLESNPNPQDPTRQVEYIRYKMDPNSNTLLRGTFLKVAGQDPYQAHPDNTLVPFVQNVMNQASPAQIAAINAQYPNMFPGGAQVPIFSYLFDTPSGPLPASDPRCFGLNTAGNIRSVIVTLIVQTPTPDPRTGRLRVVELTGRGSRINAFQ
jgi:prepilin-type N-terminal cleavage/methylation domain-containing protein